MRRQLQSFSDLAWHYSNSIGPGEFIGDRTLRQQLFRSEPTIRRIFSVLDPTLVDELDLDRMAGEDRARDLVQRALGILDDMDDWAIRLRPDAPTLPADQFHPWVWGAAHTYWDSKHYRAAVDAAAT